MCHSFDIKELGIVLLANEALLTEAFELTIFPPQRESGLTKETRGKQSSISDSFSLFEVPDFQPGPLNRASLSQIKKSVWSR